MERDDASARRFSLALPAVILAAIAAIWAGTHPGVAPWLKNKATGNPMPVKGTVKVDPVSGVVRVTVTNESPGIARCNITTVTWNEAQVKEPLPTDFSLDPFGTSTWTFHPIDERVPSYGKSTFVSISWKTPDGNGIATFGSGTGKPEVVLLKGGKSVSVELSRRAFTEFKSRPLELDQLRVGFRGKGVPVQHAEAEVADNESLQLAKLPLGSKGKGVVRYRRRVTPWSPWVPVEAYFELK